MTSCSHKPAVLWTPAVIAAVAGLAIGYTAGRLQGPESGGSTAVADSPAPPDPPARAAPPDAVDPVVPVNLKHGRGGDGPAATQGILIRDAGDDANRLLLPLIDLYQAVEGRYSAGDKTRFLGRVAAIHPGAGLALLDTGLTAEGPLTPPGAGALYLGLELEAVSARGAGGARIDTGALERDDGQTVYGAQLRSAPPDGLTALVLPDDGSLAGVLTGRRLDNGLYEAIDAYALARMEPAAGGGGAVALDRFSERFFERSPAGRRVLFHAAARDGNWRRVIETAPAVLDARPDDPAIQALLQRAYLNRVRALLEQDRPQQAVQLAADAQQVLPATPALVEAHAAALNAAGRPREAAAAWLRLAGENRVDEETRRDARQRLMDLVGGDRLAAGSRQELLRRAIERDAGYAPYHAALGDALNEQRRPAEALSRWSVAAQLDPGLHGELAPKMKKARRRVDSADGVVVPLISNGHSYFVDARINDRRQRLLLDTGASFSAISPELAETLGIDVASAARQVRLSTANGMITAPVVHLGRINLNGAAVDDLEAVVLEQLNGPGVLGLNFLNHFNIDINQAAGEMTLRR